MDRNLKNINLNNYDLINDIRSFPFIYDKSHQDYKNIKLKDEEFLNISNRHHISVIDIKKKWRNLRDTYMRELNKAKTLKSGSGLDTSKWQYFEVMDFLRPTLQPRLQWSSLDDSLEINHTSSPEHQIDLSCDSDYTLIAGPSDQSNKENEPPKKKKKYLNNPELDILNKIFLMESQRTDEYSAHQVIRETMKKLSDKAKDDLNTKIIMTCFKYLEDN